MTLTLKDIFCATDSNERTFGITTIFSPLGAFTMALYVDTGDPTFVTVLGKMRMNTDFDVEDNIKDG